MSNLNDQERSELLTVHKEDAVYYTGHGARKMVPDPDKPISKCYDDVDGYYKVVVDDHLIFRYRIVRIIGKGAHGVVVEAVDYKTQECVAVKICRNGNYFDKEASNEIKNLKYIGRHLKNNKRILRLLSSFRFRNHTCIVFECLGRDLYLELEKSLYNGPDFSKAQLIVKSILQSVRHLHTINLIHCDLKPSNIVFMPNNTAEVKIIDFSSGRLHEGNKRATYFQTRCYRAPEVILRCNFSKPVDIWSIGCIAYELATGLPLFYGSKSETLHMDRIMEVLGAPSKSLVKQWLQQSDVTQEHFLSSGEPIFASKETINEFYITKGAIPKHNKRLFKCGDYGLDLALQHVYPAIAEFILGCLKWDPEDRMTVEEALQHRWMLIDQLPPMDLQPIKAMSVKVRSSMSSPTLFKRKYPDLTNKPRKSVQPNPKEQKSNQLVRKSSEVFRKELRTDSSSTAWLKEVKDIINSRK